MKTFKAVCIPVIVAILSLAPALAAPQTFKIDSGHSQVGFKIRHLLSRVPGHFNTFSGEITVDPDNPSAAKVTAEIDAGSIDTANDKRDGHLKSPDFFNVEKNPKITFVSTGVSSATKDHATVTGNLTLAGVTKPVTLDVTALGYLDTPRGKWAGFEATTKINRKDFGITWNQPLGADRVVLGEEVEITLLVEAVGPKPEGTPAPAPKQEGATKPGAGGK